jgi:redox-sensitive bicupin YhaK (pirin superfamily)
MTAGSGVRHSEFNNDSEQDLRFIQMWFTPRASGLTPNYGSDAVGGASALVTSALVTFICCSLFTFALLLR